MVERNKTISAALDLPSLCEEVFNAAEGVLGHDRLALFLRDESGNFIELVSFRGDYPDIVQGLCLPVSGAGITTWALRQGEPCVVGDVAKDERHLPGGLTEGSELAVPLSVGAEPIGVLDVQRDIVDAFTDEDALLLLTLASHAAVAVRNLRSREVIARQQRRLQAIFECSPDAIVTTDLTGRITTFSPGAASMFGFALDEVEGQRVSEYYLEGESEAKRIQARLEERGEIKNHEVWFKKADGSHLPASMSASLLRAPDGRVLGTLGVLKDITKEKHLASKLSHTIEMLQEANENLGRLAITDSLTELANQRHFHRKLEEEIRRAGRRKRTVSLLMIDIDKFKTFNDRFGHQVGDRVLQEMGRTIHHSIRQIDLGCRYGGEEFTIILPETVATNAMVVARRVQSAFRTRRAWEELGIEPPTLSIGLASVVPQSTDDVHPDRLVKDADEAMYRAKQRGGDDVETA